MNKRIVGCAAFLSILSLQAGGRGGDADVAKDLVAKAIKAAGGDAKVAPLKAGTCKAKANFAEGGMQFAATLDITWQGTDQYRFAIAVDFGGMAKNLVVVINGDKGWAKDADRNKTEEAPKEVVPMISNMLYAMRLPHILPGLLDKDVKLAPLGEIKIGDRAALGVTISHKDRKEVRLFFDKESGLPAKSEVQLTDPRGMEKTFEFQYSDYKESAGVKHPTKINVKAEGKDIVLELSDLKAQGKVEPGLFAMPD